MRRPDRRDRRGAFALSSVGEEKGQEEEGDEKGTAVGLQSRRTGARGYLFFSVKEKRGGQKKNKEESGRLPVLLTRKKVGPPLFTRLKKEKEMRRKKNRGDANSHSQWEDRHPFTH